jgi:hypothetical protein
MKILFAITIFSAELVWAKDAITKYAIFGKEITFYSNEVLPVTASEPCKISKNKSSCLNFDILKKASLIKINRMPAGNPNTGAIICEDQLGGVSVIGLDASQNQRSFCFFEKKGIYIGNGTIEYFAKKNDNIKSTDAPFDIAP